jgi:hypothetical protein
VRDVDSFFFGRGDLLFGMYHPAGGMPRRQGVVICPALFHEYYRTHFANRRIACELAARGYDALRFDHAGTGDSRGQIPADPFTSWSQGIGQAIDKVRQLGGYRQVSIVATRFAAALALPWRKEVARYACWDPVLDAERYRKDIEAINEASLSEHPWMTPDEQRAETESDFLGTGLSRASLLHDLNAFMDQPGFDRATSLPKGSIVLQSEVNWISANLETIYEHDVIRQTSDAMSGNARESTG